MKTLIYILLTFLLIGCASRKPIETHEIKTREKLEVINQRINDKLFISVPEVRTINKDCDSLAQDAVNRFASSIKSEKTSGSNSVKIGFDKEKNAISIEANVGETKNKSETKIQIIKQKIPVKYVPKYVQVFAWIGLFSVIFVAVRTYIKVFVKREGLFS